MQFFHFTWLFKPSMKPQTYLFSQCLNSYPFSKNKFYTRSQFQFIKIYLSKYIKSQKYYYSCCCYSEKFHPKIFSSFVDLASFSGFWCYSSLLGLFAFLLLKWIACENILAPDFYTYILCRIYLEVLEKFCLFISP